MEDIEMWASRIKHSEHDLLRLAAQSGVERVPEAEALAVRSGQDHVTNPSADGPKAVFFKADECSPEGSVQVFDLVRKFVKRGGAEALREQPWGHEVGIFRVPAAAQFPAEHLISKAAGGSRDEDRLVALIYVGLGRWSVHIAQQTQHGQWPYSRFSGDLKLSFSAREIRMLLRGERLAVTE